MDWRAADGAATAPAFDFRCARRAEPLMTTWNQCNVCITPQFRFLLEVLKVSREQQASSLIYQRSQRCSAAPKFCSSSQASTLSTVGLLFIVNGCNPTPQFRILLEVLKVSRGTDWIA